MGYRFGSESEENLDTCHPLIQEILYEAIQYTDFSVLCGFRDEEAQTRAFETGRSKVQWPNGTHNKNPSHGVDVAPYPIDWKNINRFAYLMGVIKGIALSKGIRIRMGCDWDDDGDITDHKFMDWGHFELVDTE